MLALGLILLWPRAHPKAAPQFVATLIRAHGLSIPAGMRLAAGSWIEVPANGTATLSIGNGSSLRLNGGTRVQLVSPAVTQLEYGAAYLDCPSPAADVTVRTAAGDFAPAGTQFEVRVGPGGLTRLRVREGIVTLQRMGAAVRARAGEQFTVSPDGTLQRATILPYDATWRWVEGVAPMINIEGTSLRAFLEWIAREKGWTLEFTDEHSDPLSATIVLHGSIADMTLDDALKTIAAGSGFTYRVENGVLRIDGL